MRWPKRTRNMAAAARFSATSSADRRLLARFTAERMLARQVAAGPGMVPMVMPSFRPQGGRRPRACRPARWEQCADDPDDQPGQGEEQEFRGLEDVNVTGRKPG